MITILYHLKGFRIMKKVMLYLFEEMDRNEIHEELYRVLSLPEYYGRNLDALHDCLTDISEDTVLAVYLPDDRSTYMDRLCRVLRDAELENRHLAVVFNDPAENADDL